MLRSRQDHPGGDQRLLLRTRPALAQRSTQKELNSLRACECRVPLRSRYPFRTSNIDSTNNMCPSCPQHEAARREKAECSARMAVKASTHGSAARRITLQGVKISGTCALIRANVSQICLVSFFVRRIGRRNTRMRPHSSPDCASSRTSSTT